jgi:hopene-associated glycosyltransferase HpnB
MAYSDFSIAANVSLGLPVLSLTIWLWLLTFWGQFWRCDQRLDKAEATPPPHHPTICAVIPARNEAELLPVTLRSLLTQHYPGKFSIILVDDHSTDGTAQVARETTAALGKSEQLQVVLAAPLPPGWTGKLWAMEQGVQRAQMLEPDYILLTDADIQHPPENLGQLVTKAKQEQRQMVSLMVLLRCQSFWEKLLIPSFVFFFQKLYPFAWVNNPTRSTAAAAGGCILIQRETLNQIGGIQTVRQALIDDCALASAVKRGERQKAEGGGLETGNIWLGLSQDTRSLRAYDSLQTIWDMVARTAYTQLNYSPLLLLGTLIGMTLIYLVPPIAAIAGLATGNSAIALAGWAGWALMTLAYLPTVRLYGISPVWATCLPFIAFLYTLMTLDSALRHWRGQGGAWKGRIYTPG